MNLHKDQQDPQFYCPHVLPATAKALTVVIRVKRLAVFLFSLQTSHATIDASIQLFNFNVT